METRLSLRQRLLRIGDGVVSSATDSNSLSTSSWPAIPETTRRSNQSRSTPSRPEQPQEELGEEEEEDDDDVGDEEGGEDDAELDEDDDGADLDVRMAQSNGSSKCATSTVVKLLFSRSDPLGRNPTVCFDYPPALDSTRDYTGQHVVTVSAQEFPLLYRTSWERNCVKNAFAAAGLSRTRKKWSAWHLAWAKHVNRTQFKRFKGDHPQAFNHFPDPWVLGRKDRLLKTLVACRRRFGASYDFFPEGYELPEQLDTFQRALERAEASPVCSFPLFSSSSVQDSDCTVMNQTKKPKAIAPLWIVKPPASACGRGIRVLTHREASRFCEDVRKRTKSKKRPAKARIVQRYVANPLLFDGGFKFDLRLYVLVTSMDPLRIYLFREGIARFCTAPYSLKDPSNRFAHLTNYSINKRSGGFVENADAQQADAGSKWSLTALLRALQTQRRLEDPATLLREIRSIICKTVIAAESHLTPLTHQFVKQPGTSCFELFGFDFMLDSQLRPWLIEVNVSPSLMGGSPLDRSVKGLLLSDIFHLVGLQVPLASVRRENLPPELQRSAMAASATSATSSAPPSSSASSCSSSSSSRPRPFRRSKTMHGTPAARQLHELVLDSTVERFEASHLDLFAPSDWDLVRAMDDEMDRRGHFDRIFPASASSTVASSTAAAAVETASYTRFFTCQRYANALCAKWLQTPRSVRLRLQRQQSTGSQSTAPKGARVRANPAVATAGK